MAMEALEPSGRWGERASFIVDVLELRNAPAVLEVFAHCPGGGAAELEQPVRGSGELLHRLQERCGIALGNEQAIAAARHGLGNAAVLRREYRESGSHGLEHGIRDALHISVGRGFAGMNEDV